LATRAAWRRGPGALLGCVGCAYLPRLQQIAVTQRARAPSSRRGNSIFLANEIIDVTAAIDAGATAAKLGMVADLATKIVR
jgi:hypothetical protein